MRLTLNDDLDLLGRSDIKRKQLNSHQNFGHLLCSEGILYDVPTARFSFFELWACLEGSGICFLDPAMVKPVLVIFSLLLGGIWRKNLSSVCSVGMSNVYVNPKTVC